MFNEYKGMNLLAMNLMYAYLLAMIVIDSFTHSGLVAVVNAFLACIYCA